MNPRFPCLEWLHNAFLFICFFFRKTNQMIAKLTDKIESTWWDAIFFMDLPTVSVIVKKNDNGRIKHINNGVITSYLKQMMQKVISRKPWIIYQSWCTTSVCAIFLKRMFQLIVDDFNELWYFHQMLIISAHEEGAGGKLNLLCVV